ncbi:MAG: hypothetical protein HC806_06810 [Anaerolineae bacterium]|nr:hypothetical protein [Anaerolineae bacterium]
MLSDSKVEITETVFLSNTADYGGGLIAYDKIHVSQGLFEGNIGLEDGGGIYAVDDIKLTHSSFLNNTAIFRGGGLYATDITLVVDSTFVGNSALKGNGGGINITIPVINGVYEDQLAGGDPGLVMTRTHFIGNTAMEFGGGISAYQSLSIHSSTFIGNEANYGGGYYQGTGDALFINTLFAKNTALTAASVIAWDSPGDLSILHATIVGDTQDNPSAIGIFDGSLWLANSIVTQFIIGIRNIGGIVNQDYNLFYQNDTDIDGTYTGGTHNVDGNPNFIAPENNNYHLGPSSAALDMGTDVGIAFDVDGHPRPYGLGFDVGYDEANFIPQDIYLPMIER